jgi:predicted amidohydrolase
MTAVAAVAEGVGLPRTNGPEQAFRLADVAPWVCRAEIAPRVWRDDAGGLWTESNGSEGCYGGWELRFDVDAVDVPAGRPCRVAIEAEGNGLERGRDQVTAEAFWFDGGGKQVDWQPLLAERIEDGAGGALRVLLAGRTPCPPGAAHLRVRCGLRWTERGRVRWHGWRIEPAVERAPRTLRLGVASGRPVGWSGVEAATAHYVEQCRLAGEAGLDLVCLPETILTWGADWVPELARAAAMPVLPVPGPWLEPFRAVAREYRMGICFSVLECAGSADELVYNTALLLGRDGELIGAYRKVHLAIAEIWRGVTAGTEFPVYEFDGVRVGMMVCMDTTAPEALRALAVQGAEVVLMPIMNDFRATPWTRDRRGTFDTENWKLVQRSHAFTNHIYLVSAKNVTMGSCVTAPWGEILAYNDGDRDVIWADVDVDDARPHPVGSSKAAVLQWMRRPALYGTLVARDLPVGAPALRA